MQGRQGKGEGAWDKTASQRIPSVQGTGQYRALPQRPSTMARVKQPPTTPRVGRPKREQAQPVSLKRRLLTLGCVALVCAVLACIGTTIVVNYVTAINATSGAASTAVNFLTALQNGNYDQAYTYLGPAITLSKEPDVTQFAQRAKNIDACYGTVKDYAEVKGSAQVTDTKQSYTYTITRSKLNKPYQLHLVLQQDGNASNSWKIIDYGTTLGPPDQPATCS